MFKFVLGALAGLTVAQESSIIDETSVILAAKAHKSAGTQSAEAKKSYKKAKAKYDLYVK